MSADIEPWTARTVSFVPHPEPDPDGWEALHDWLVQDFMDTWWGKRAGTVVTANEDTITVVGLPWWMTGGLARRKVAMLAFRCGLGGDAEYKVWRSVLG